MILTNSQIKELFDMADEAKSVGDFPIANAVFGFLLGVSQSNDSIQLIYERSEHRTEYWNDLIPYPSHEYEDYQGFENYLDTMSDKEYYKRLNIQTIVETGYYDLFVLKFRDRFLNIPMPLVNSAKVNDLINQVINDDKIIERGEHNRNTHPALNTICQKMRLERILSKYPWKTGLIWLSEEVTQSICARLNKSHKPLGAANVYSMNGKK